MPLVTIIYHPEPVTCAPSGRLSGNQSLSTHQDCLFLTFSSSILPASVILSLRNPTHMLPVYPRLPLQRPAQHSTITAFHSHEQPHPDVVVVSFQSRQCKQTASDCKLRASLSSKSITKLPVGCSQGCHTLYLHSNATDVTPNHCNLDAKWYVFIDSVSSITDCRSRLSLSCVVSCWGLRWGGSLLEWDRSKTDERGYCRLAERMDRARGTWGEHSDKMMPLRT